ncbi:hypothetical protein M758_3G083300 [Ceratodon purpureus]|nr:hypothetical protein M758_3G083300 [Ceratodon purpureus]
MEGLQRRVAMGEGAADGGQCDVGGAGVLGLEVNVAKPDGAPDGSEAMVEDANSLRMQVDGGQCDVEGVGVLGLEVNVAKPDGSDAMVEDANSFRMQVDGGQCDGVLGLEVNVAKPDGAPDGSDAMVEDATSLRMQVDGNEGAGSDAGASSCDTIGALGDACSMGRTERIRADIGTGDDDQIESSLISGFEAQNPGVGSSSQPDSEADIEEGYGHLFTDIMKIQLRAQILVLGDLLKGIAPSPEWLEEACLEPGIGVEYALPEPLDAPRDVPPESNLQNLEVTMSPSAESTDPPTVTTAGRLSNPEDPSTSGKDFLYIDDLAQERDVAPSGQLMITYDDTTTARSNPNTAENISQATDTLVHENDKHLDLAQASAQDALTTATSALAQSHMVWARLHSQNHSEEGIARDARIASVAATVAAAASVAKAAVEAARAIAEVSVDAFIQAGGYQAGDTSLAQLGSTRSKPLQVAGLNQSLHGNTRENTSQHRTDMVESVVQAAGKAAEAATQAGVVLSKANPLIQMSGLSEFWSRKRNEGSEEHERNEFGGIDEGNGMDVTNEVGGFGGRRKGDASNEINAVNEVGELDGGNEEDAAEEMEDTQEEDTVSQDILNLDDIMGDVHGGDIANQDFAVEGDMVAPNGDQDGTAAANEAEVFVENGVGMVEANEDEDVGANEVELVPVNEVAEAIEQEKYIGPRSRKSKRGRGRGRGRSQEAPSRAKRLKNSVGASSAIPVAQALENEMHQGEPESPKNDGDANARSEERGVLMKNSTMSTSGKDISDSAPLEPYGEDTPASAAAQIPEDEIQRKDDAPESPKTVRGGNARGRKRGAKGMVRTPVTTSRKGVPPAVPVQASWEERPSPAAAHSKENDMEEQGGVPESLKTVRGGYTRGKKRGGRQVGRTLLRISRKVQSPTVSAPSGEDQPASAAARTPGKEMLREDDGREIAKTVRGGYTRGKKRGGRQVGRTLLRISRKVQSPTVSAPSGEDQPAAVAAHIKENEKQEEDDVRESPKTVRGGYTRGKKRGGRQVGRSPLSTTRKDLSSTVSAPSGEDRPASAAARSPGEEMLREDEVRESPKTGRGGYMRGKKRGGRQVGRSPLSTTREGVPPAVSAQASWEERPSPASAHTKENEMQEEDDVRESPKTGRGGYTRGKKRGGMQVGRTPLRISRKVQPPTVSAPLGEDQPASAAALTKVNKMQEEDDIRESPKNVTCENVSGKKRGVKKMVKTLVSTSRKDAPPLSAADDCSPENGMQREGDVSENPKVRGGSARGKKRGAKEIEKTPVSASGKGTAERDLREPESDRNIRDVPEHAVEGSAVEVMTDEVGLRGGWFSGTVLKMNPNEAFVELHDLLTDDGKSNVREWFPLVEGFNPDRPRRHIRPIHPFSIFTEAGSRKRRRVALGSQTWHIGDHVDAFFQDAWWEGIVAELNDLYPSKATIYFPEENDTQVVKTWDLRPSFQWKDNKWTPWKNPVLLEDERPQKRHRTVGPIKSSTKGGPEDLIAQKSNGKSSTQRTERVEIPEDSRTIPEPISSRKKTPIKMLQESKISFKRSSRSKMSFKRLKTSENEDASQKQEGLSTMTRRRAQLKDVLSPGTSKKLDFTTDSIASTASASKVDASRNKASITKAKPRHWRKKVLSDVALLQD